MRRFFLSHFGRIFSAMLFLVPAAALHAQENNPQLTKKDLAAFGQLPVRFNGRVTTYDVVAKNYLRRFSGRDVCYDKAEKEHPAVRWLLDVMAEVEGQDDWRIFQITNPKLLEQLDLGPDERGKVHRQHFSLSEIRPKLDWIQEKGRELAAVAWAKREAYDRAVSELSDHITYCLVLKFSFAPFPAINRENAKAIIDRLQLLESHPMPLFVPTAQETQWWSYPRAALQEIIAGNDAEKQNLLFQQLRDVLNAHHAQDAKAFQQNLDRYAQSLKTAQALNSPFEMLPPKAWLEVGVPSTRTGHFYNDANAPGHKIVEMYLAGTHYSEFMVNHFQGQDVSPVELQNSWRIMLGLVPLSDADARKVWRPFQVAGRKAILIDDSTPVYIDKIGLTRFVTVVLQEEGHTFVFAWSGEKDIIARNGDAFEQLMKSIRMKSIKELAEWFKVEGQTPPPLEDRFLAAVVPDGKQVWVFVTSGPENAVESHRQAFLTFLKSLEFKKTNEQRTEPKWQLPEGWTKIGDYGEATLLLGQDENVLPMTVIPLGDVRDDTVSTLTDYWAKKLRLGKLSDKEREACIKEITAANRKAYLIDIRRPEEIEKVSDVTYQAPKGWKTLPPGPLVHGSFEIAQSEMTAKITIMALPNKGDLAANINRWRSQIELPVETPDKALESAKPFPIDKQPGKFVELHNPNTHQRIFVAVVTHLNRDWYFKVLGDAALVEKEQKAFEDFLKTVKFIEKEQER